MSTLPNVDDDEIVRVYREMVMIRRFEEAVTALKDAGEVPGSVHLCNGQEAIPVGVAATLRADDPVTATYRGHGWALVRGLPMPDVFAEMMGRESPLCGGRAGSPYFSSRPHSFVGENSIVGAGMPIAVGAALAAKYDRSGRVSVVSIGDGAMNQGAAHEALNFAAVFTLPLVVVLENNRYSEMTPIADMVRVARLADRLSGYGIPAVSMDGNDPWAVRAAATEAVERARSGGGPSLIETHTQRLVGHHSGDAQHYRPQGEVAAALEDEPIVRVRRLASSHGDELAGRLDAVDCEVAEQVDRAIGTARSIPFPSAKSVMEHVYV